VVSLVWFVVLTTQGRSIPKRRATLLEVGLLAWLILVPFAIFARDFPWISNWFSGPTTMPPHWTFWAGLQVRKSFAWLPTALFCGVPLLQVLKRQNRGEPARSGLERATSAASIVSLLGSWSLWVILADLAEERAVIVGWGLVVLLVSGLVVRTWARPVHPHERCGEERTILGALP
jgi:hypothetical protein